MNWEWDAAMQCYRYRLPDGGVSEYVVTAQYIAERQPMTATEILKALAEPKPVFNLDLTPLYGKVADLIVIDDPAAPEYTEEEIQAGADIAAAFGQR